MRFESPWAFLILCAVPAALLLKLWLARKHASLRFSSTEHVQRVNPSLRQRLLWVPSALRLILLVCLAVALARPQEGRERIRDTSKGVAIEMVIDRSGSMRAEMQFGDSRINRLEAVKRVFREFVAGSEESELKGRPNDLIGMVTFARYADTVCPLTLAHGALAEFLKSVKLVTRRSEDGTAVGDAIALAAARLKTAEETIARQTDGKQKDFSIKSKVIILLTDGRNNAGQRTPEQAAELAKKWGIRIYSIGVGGEESITKQDGLFGQFLVRMGEGVDRDMLKSVAETAGGRFFMAEDGKSLRSIYREIDRMERSEIESVRYLDYRELFMPFAFAGLVLLCTEILLNSTVFRRIP